MEWNYIEYVRNFYKIERIVKSNWDKKEGKIKYQLVVTVKLLLVHMTPRPKFTIGGSYERYIYSKEWDDKGTNVSSSFN